MNWKRFINAVIVGFVALLVMDFIIHWGILGEIYKPLTGTLLRSEADMSSKMWAYYIGAFFFSILFVLIYTHGVKGKGVIEGFRFGIYIGLFYIAVGSLMTWPMIPFPGALLWLWTIFGMIEMIILGLIVGAIYKPIKE